MAHWLSPALGLLLLFLGRRLFWFFVGVVGFSVGHLPWATIGYLVLVTLGVTVQARWWQARPKMIR